ncbi:MAG: hypothetical protein ACJAZO_004897 [Myxococcota bacterium]|jgi:hypothetical protein
MKTLGTLLALLMTSQAHAHLMVKGHGTLNIQDNGAFLLVALPLSSFSGFDCNGDGTLSEVEFARHYDSLVEQTSTRLRWREGDDARPLQGLLLNRVSDHDDGSAYIVVMGRFTVENAESGVLDIDSMRFADAGTELSVAVTYNGTVRDVVFTPQRLESSVLHDSRG